MRYSDSQYCEICRERIEIVADGMLCCGCGNLVHIRCVPARPSGMPDTCPTCGCSLLTEAAVRLRTERERDALAARRSRLPALLPWMLAATLGIAGLLTFGTLLASTLPAVPAGGGFDPAWLALTGASGAVCAALGWALGDALRRRRKRRKKER
jgi:hypothetical protein